MQQKTLIALGALAAIAIAAWLTLRAPEKGQRIGPPPRPQAALKASDVKELELTTNGKDKVILKLDGTTWKLTAPGAFVADQPSVKTAVEQLEKTTYGDIVTELPAKHAEFEVSDDKGAHVVAKDAAGKVLFDALLGKATSGFTMLRPAGKNEVWQASGLFKYTYAKDAKGWRDHTIFEFTKDDVSKLVVEAGTQKLVLEKIAATDKAADAKWKVLESSVKVDPLDDSVANNMIQSLGSLKAADFDDGAKPETVGLAPPQVKLTATVKGQPLGLLVGNAKGDDSWVGVVGRPQIYLLQKYLLERLAVKPQNFRDKTLVNAKESDLVEVGISIGTENLVLKHEGEKWSAGKAVVDDGKVKSVVTAFDGLAGSAFSDSLDPKVTGLAKPAGAVSLKLRDKSQVIIKFGAVKDGTDYYAQKIGSPDVMMIKKYSVDRFLKKASDLAKSAEPPPGGRPPGMPMGMPGMQMQ
ncbi:MAG: DUF4340 domain-containing protein [Myxococcales bacterium]|nr:DUF4340 domain-containing protein [Myxococcales bacterium]